MATAYSYIRFSSIKQRKGISESRQREWAVEWCQEQGHTLDTGLKLADRGVSAFKGKNSDTGALGQFLRHAERGAIPKGSYLLVENLDRLSRDVATEALNLIQRIVKTGVTIITREPYRELTKENINDLGILIEIIVTGYRAHEESQRKSFHQTQSWIKRRKRFAETGQILTARCPSWLKVSDDGKRFVTIADKVKAVKLAFKLRASGLGTYSIVRRFNQEGIAPLNPGAKSWNTSGLKLIFKSRQVLGELQMGKGYGSRQNRSTIGEPVEGYYPQIVDEATWYKVQTLLETDKHKNKGGGYKQTVTNLFSGLLFDAADGSSMQLHESNGVKRLVSMNAKKGLSEYIAFPYTVFESSFLRWTDEIQAKDIVPSADKSETEAELDEAQGHVRALVEKIGKIKTKIKTTGDVEALIDLIADMEIDKKQTETKIEQLKAELHNSHAASLDETRQLVRQLAKSGDEETRDRLKSRIAGLVARIDCVLAKASNKKLHMICQVRFESGQVKHLWIITKAIYGKPNEYNTSSMRFPVKGLPSADLDLCDEETREALRDMM